VVKKRAPRTRQPRDEERARDAAIRNLGIERAVADQAQTAGEERTHIVASEDAAEPRQTGLVFEALQEKPKRASEVLSAEVVEVRLPPRRVQQRLVAETLRSPPSRRSSVRRRPFTTRTAEGAAREIGTSRCYGV
jgi:hypothetical protein